MPASRLAIALSAALALLRISLAFGDADASCAADGWRPASRMQVDGVGPSRARATLSSRTALDQSSPEAASASCTFCFEPATERQGFWTRVRVRADRAHFAIAVRGTLPAARGRVRPRYAPR